MLKSVVIVLLIMSTLSVIAQPIDGKTYRTKFNDTVYVYKKDKKVHTVLCVLSFEECKITIYKSGYEETPHLSLRLNFNSTIDLLRFNTVIMFDECNNNYIQDGIIGVALKNGYSSTTKTAQETFRNSITLVFEKFKINTLEDISSFELTSKTANETHIIKLKDSERERLNSVVSLFNRKKL